MGERKDFEEKVSERAFSEIAQNIKTPYCVAIIPCKTGSVRLPDKNFLEVGGYPMVIWAVSKAMCCPDIDLICISTDNPELLLEKVPRLKAQMFEDVICINRSTSVLHPDTPIYVVLMDALKTLASNNAFVRPPTHIVMLQPNVPTIPQKVVNALVASVKKGDFHVARHFTVDPFQDCEDCIAGPMSGGCDAYKIGALGNIQMMDSYNFAIITADPEVHTQDDLDMVRDIIARRMKDETEKE